MDNEKETSKRAAELAWNECIFRPGAPVTVIAYAPYIPDTDADGVSYSVSDDVAGYVPGSTVETYAEEESDPGCIGWRKALGILQKGRARMDAVKAPPPPVQPPDAVNHPSHYTSHPSGVECIDITRHMGFSLGNAVKYIWRADLKGAAGQDLRKALFYVADEIAKREGSTASVQALTDLLAAHVKAARDTNDETDAQRTERLKRELVE